MTTVELDPCTLQEDTVIFIVVEWLCAVQFGDILGDIPAASLSPVAASATL
jgi:hypothetical protein